MTVIKHSMCLIILMVMLNGCMRVAVTQDSGQDNLPIAYTGYSGQYNGFSLMLDERFDRFDKDIWKIGDGAVGGEAICRFQPQGVQVDNGILNLIIREEPIAAGWSNDHQQDKGVYDFSCGEA